MTNPIKVAESLTEAQRAAIRDAILQGGDFLPVSHLICTHRALVRKGLARKRVGIANCLTPLGLTVRSILTGEDER